jgi:hypothetical protein
VHRAIVIDIQPARPSAALLFDGLTAAGKGTATAGRAAGILTEYAQHYNEHRPHQAREQRAPLCEPVEAIDLTTRIKRRQTVQGLINEYARAA